jgi:hypothetical protein
MLTSEASKATIVVSGGLAFGASDSIPEFLRRFRHTP